MAIDLPTSLDDKEGERDLLWCRPFWVEVFWALEDEIWVGYQGNLAMAMVTRVTHRFSLNLVRYLTTLPCLLAFVGPLEEIHLRMPCGVSQVFI